MFSHILETFSWKPGQPRYNDKKKTLLKFIVRINIIDRFIYIYSRGKKSGMNSRSEKVIRQIRRMVNPFTV